MAISIPQKPILHSPAYNPLDFVVTSTNTAQANFRYICDIYITGVTPAFFRLYADKDPQFNSGHFNINRVVENFVSGNITLADYGFQVNQNSFKKYQCKFGESYGPSSGVVVYEDLTDDSVRYAWNGVMDFIEFKNYVSPNYLLSYSSQQKFLTARPEPDNIDFITSNENAWVYMMIVGSDTVISMEINTYDSAGNNLQTVTISNPYSSAGSIDNHKFLRFSIGTKQLNIISAGLITPSVAKYTYQTFNDSGDPTSELRTFNVKENCSKDTSVRLHFLNKLGGFDSFTFWKRNVQTADIKRSKYKRIAGGMTSANSWAYNKSDSLEINFDINISDKIHLVSDWINENQSIWLEELVTSPWVLLDDPNDGLISVNIVDTKYNRKKNAFDKTFNLEIDIEFTYNRYRQRL